jgi:hypothetical protein
MIAKTMSRIFGDDLDIEPVLRRRPDSIVDVPLVWD